jgi:hypothetical protein
MKIARLLTGNKKGMYLSPTNPNWMSNGGSGTYKQAIRIIRLVRFLHLVTHRPCKLEWIVWE